MSMLLLTTTTMLLMSSEQAACVALQVVCIRPSRVSGRRR